MAAADLNTFLIMSNLALVVAIFYMVLMHHNETKHKKASRR